MFDCFKNPVTPGRRWPQWLTSFELFADGKGLLVVDDTPAAPLQFRKALLLHHAGPDVQDIFSTLHNAGRRADYDAAVIARNNIFFPFHALLQRQGETVQPFATRLRPADRDCVFDADMDNQICD